MKTKIMIKETKKLENVLSDSMTQVEYWAEQAKSDLNCDLITEGEITSFSYDINEYYDVFKWINEEAVVDYFLDYLQDEFASIKEKYGVEPTIEIDGDGTLVISVDLEACI